jgi:hypothetical protein
MVAETRAAGSAAETAAAPPAVGVPLDEAAAAIERTRALLADAADALGTGDDEQTARAYDLVAGSSDQIARALWFLRRLERERPSG